MATKPKPVCHLKTSQLKKTQTSLKIPFLISMRGEDYQEVPSTNQALEFRFDKLFHNSHRISESQDQFHYYQESRHPHLVW